jgi:hypothetical protein
LATLPNKIELNIELPVMEMYLGTPEFVLDANNIPIDFNLTERSVQEIISQGYIQGEKTVLADKKIKTENISRLFVTNIVNKNLEAKIPVVILKKGNNMFSFPISLNKTKDSQVARLDEIESKQLSPIEEVKEVNNLLISLGSNTRISGLSDITLDDVRKELENYETFRTADELADPNYKKESLIVDATIKIDLEDKLISSPKITVDYSKAIIGTQDNNEKGAIELRQDIVKDLLEIRKIVNTTPNISENNRFVQAFDNEDVENKGTDIINRKDVNFIRKVFFNENGKLALQGNIVDIIGREKLVNLRDKLEKLQFFEDQIKTIKDREGINKLSCN